MKLCISMNIILVIEKHTFFMRVYYAKCDLTWNVFVLCDALLKSRSVLHSLFYSGVVVKRRIFAGKRT